MWVFTNIKFLPRKEFGFQLREKVIEVERVS
jgi:hypothetical protein